MENKKDSYLTWKPYDIILKIQFVANELDSKMWHHK
jgi:hypothetical protein